MVSLGVEVIIRWKPLYTGHSYVAHCKILVKGLQYLQVIFQVVISGWQLGFLAGYCSESARYSKFENESNITI